MTLISLVYGLELGWIFVTTNSDSSSQIFGWTPILISAAIGSTNVQTLALEVEVPSSYTSTDDAAQLRTMYLGYIETPLVDTLALALKNTKSPFYTGVNNSVAEQLASLVDSSFSVNSVPGSSGAGGGSSGSSGGSGSGGSSSDTASGAAGASKSRQDAIIGVVSALGAIALAVLGFLLFRAWKRKQELAHRRLSDPVPGTGEFDVGVRPEGREFDQDSVGGQRRRSFYFAADSLRFEGGSQVQQSQAVASSSGQGQQMLQRRALGGQQIITPGAISAPILRENSMNW